MPFHIFKKSPSTNKEFLELAAEAIDRMISELEWYLDEIEMVRSNIGFEKIELARRHNIERLAVLKALDAGCPVTSAKVDFLIEAPLLQARRDRGSITKAIKEIAEANISHYLMILRDRIEDKVKLYGQNYACITSEVLKPGSSYTNEDVHEIGELLTEGAVGFEGLCKLIDGERITEHELAVIAKFHNLHPDISDAEVIQIIKEFNAHKPVAIPEFYNTAFMLKPKDIAGPKDENCKPA